MEKPNNEKHEITEREKRAWQAGKKRPSRERPKLTIAQRIEFLNMVATMASHNEFERRLNLTPGDITYYKKQLDVETQDEARRLHRKMKRENEELREATIIEENKRVRAAEEVAQQRLNELEARRNKPSPVKVRDTLAIKKEDAERQRRLESQESEIAVPDNEWQLPVEGTESQRQEQVDRFRRELLYRGLSFVRNKYNVSNAQIKFEASRLGLKINWQIVRR